MENEAELQGGDVNRSVVFRRSYVGTFIVLAMFLTALSFSPTALIVAGVMLPLSITAMLWVAVVVSDIPKDVSLRDSMKGIVFGSWLAGLVGAVVGIFLKALESSG